MKAVLLRSTVFATFITFVVFAISAGGTLATCTSSNIVLADDAWCTPAAGPHDDVVCTHDFRPTEATVIRFYVVYAISLWCTHLAMTKLLTMLTVASATVAAAITPSVVNASCPLHHLACIQAWDA